MFKLSSCWSNWHSYSTKRPLTKWSALRVKSWHHLSTTHWICIQPHPFQMVLKSRRRIRMPIPTFSSGLRKNGQHIGIARNPSQQTQQLMEGYMLYLSLRMGMETPWVPHSSVLSIRLLGRSGRPLNHAEKQLNNGGGPTPRLRICIDSKCVLHTLNSNFAQIRSTSNNGLPIMIPKLQEVHQEGTWSLCLGYWTHPSQEVG